MKIQMQLQVYNNYNIRGNLRLLKIVVTHKSGCQALHSDGRRKLLWGPGWSQPEC